jgi:hypothetical protein
MHRRIEVSEWSNSDGRGNGYSVRFIDIGHQFTTTHEFEVEELDSTMMRRMTLWINLSEYWNDEDALKNLENQS